LRIAYFDCFSGASGDMLLGSLLDAGLALADLEADLARLAVGGYRLAAGRVTRRGLTGTHFQVLPSLSPPRSGGEEEEEEREGHHHRHSDGEEEGHHHPHSGGEEEGEGHHHRHSDEENHGGDSRPARTLPAIEAILDASELPGQVKLRSLAVFRRIARVEAAIHGTTMDHVHFHEVGAVDSLVDIVGFACALERLGINAVYSSPLVLGGGTVRTEHGRLPAPAPATLALLAEVGAPTLPGPAPLASPAGVELVTPTGAALLTEYAAFQRPAMSIQSVGYGFGTRELDWPNALRVWIGEALSASPPAGDDSVVELACNLDDATGELLGYTMDCLLAAGALDVWFTPIQMKKNRPAALLSVLARPEDAAALAALLLSETPTLGVRRQIQGRTVAGREVRQVETPWGTVRVKIKLLDGRPAAASPEYDDCARLATTAGVPLAGVMAAACRAAGF
jgi:uncharacterized protein (TIGR00299 family) protein